MSRLTTVVLAAALSVTLAVPGNTRAGEREWATAGKILTGVFLAGLVREACAPRTVCVPARCEAVTVERVIIRRDGLPPCSPPPPPPRPAAIIIHLGGGYRLYQPPVCGHPAWVQVWCAGRRQWVTIREHPCLW